MITLLIAFTDVTISMASTTKFKLLTGLRALVFVPSLWLISSRAFNNIDEVTDILNDILNWVVQLNW